MNAQGRTIEIPGLIDLQVNGYRGVDFCDPALTTGAFARACRWMLEAGTTAFVPTLITSSRRTYEHNLPIIAEVLDSPEFRGRVPGIHLEGPFINPQAGARGAHKAEWVSPPDVGYLKRLLKWARGKAVILTLAADVDGAEDLARCAADHGAAVFLGHHLAGEEHLRRLALAGATAVTHLGNGVPAQLHRHNNPVVAALGEDRLAATLITDGQHLPPAMIKTILRTKGPANCAVISDIAHLAGLSPGPYEVGGQPVVLADSGRIYDPATGYLAGSSSTMLQCMNHLASLDLLTAEQLASVAFDNPLRLIGRKPQEIAAGPKIRYDTAARFFYVDKDE